MITIKIYRQSIFFNFFLILLFGENTPLFTPLLHTIPDSRLLPQATFFFSIAVSRGLAYGTEKFTPNPHQFSPQCLDARVGR